MWYQRRQNCFFCDALEVLDLMSVFTGNRDPLPRQQALCKDTA